MMNSRGEIIESKERRDRGNFEASFSPFGMYKFRISCAHKFYANSILLFFSSKLHCDLLLRSSSLCARCVALCDVRAFRQFTQFTFPTVLCVFLFSVFFLRWLVLESTQSTCAPLSSSPESSSIPQRRWKRRNSYSRKKTAKRKRRVE